MKIKNKKYYLVFFGLIVISFIVVFFYNLYPFLYRKYVKQSIDKKANNTKVLLDIPFISQTSFDGDLFNLGCEEVSILMVKLYIQNETLNKNEQEKELNQMIKTQKELFGGHFQMGTEKVAQFVKKEYNLKSSIIDIQKEKDLTDWLDNGMSIIMPVTAKYLENPFYRERGYHMVVVIGYNKDGFIVHDPGTISGEKYFYPYDKLLSAVSDIDKQKKGMIIYN